MNLQNPRRLYLLMWGVGTLMVALAVFWGIRLFMPDPHLKAGITPLEALPEVKLDNAGKRFVRALPVLDNSTAPTLDDDVPVMLIPELEVEQPIVELPAEVGGWGIAGLGGYIGHLEGTDVPGGEGNTVFAGHISLSDGSPGPLANIERLSPGDLITVRFGRHTYTYEVVLLQQVGADHLDVIYPTAEPTLTLITCSRWSWLNGRYVSRDVVVARLVTDPG
ncbi:MAG: sortase [Anaerolineae bacterium]|nr:sortase [Anaerolineae bacterium]